MNTIRFALILSLLGAASAYAQQPSDAVAPIRSSISTTAAGELIVTQEVLIDAPVGDVWAAYTTPAGWTAWASAEAEIELRAGGTIRTHYEDGAAIGNTGTNTLHIINYVPERVLTLQAELQDNWPEVMKEDAGELMNVIVFEPLGPERTRLLSYGVGYRDTEAYRELMEFFIPANEGLLATLKATLER